MTRSTRRKMIPSCGLAFGPEGGLYVTDAGVPANSGNCVAVALGMNCFSETGKVTRL